MPSARVIKSVISEYGLGWVVNRSLYSAKLKLMRSFPGFENWFEKKTGYPKRVDLFKPDINALRSFLQNELDDNDKTNLIETADKICKGIIKGFSSVELDYGNPIDWQLNPLTGKHCDEKEKWYRIPDFDSERGDIKVIWEASRFSHFITLSRAFLLTEDKKYYSAFSTQLSDWLDKNIYSFGANYKCGQECSFRMVNALIAYSVFSQSGVSVKTDSDNVKELVYRCYRKILSNFFYAYKCIKNNHTISELMGMIVGAWCVGDEIQLDKAYKTLNEVIKEQFFEDGGYCQYSFNYQRLALQDIEVIICISGETGHKLSDEALERIRKSALLMYQCQDDSGDMPNYGPNDGTLVFPLSSCNYRDFKPAINTAYSLASGNQLYSDGKHKEELIWLGGGEPLKAYTYKETLKVASQFKNAGLFTLREEGNWMMVIANDYHSRPAHMDQNHIDLWMNGVNVLCDLGTYSYASESGRRFVKNISHNTAVIDDIDQMNLHGPFMIYDWPKRDLERCDKHNITIKINSSNGYSHIRSITQTDFGYEICDLVDRNYKLYFYTPCEVVINENNADFIYNNNLCCKLVSTAILSSGTSERSVFYLKKSPIRCITLESTANVEVVTKIILQRKN